MKTALISSFLVTLLATIPAHSLASPQKQKEMQMEVRELMSNNFRDYLWTSAEKDKLLLPVVLAICTDQLEMSRGTLKYRVNITSMDDVARAEAQTLMRATLVAPGETDEELEDTYREHIELILNFCFMSIAERAEALIPLGGSVNMEISDRLQQGIIGRATNILKMWRTAAGTSASQLEKAFIKLRNKHYDQMFSDILDEKQQRRREIPNNLRPAVIKSSHLAT